MAIIKSLLPRICGGGNIKLGASVGTFSTLYGDASYYIDALKMSVCGTCGQHCAHCKHACYVRKSYRYGSVMLRHAVNTLALRESVENCYSALHAQLARKRKPFDIIRINQSGELESEEQFFMWVRLARDFPATQFYVYTKAFELVTPALLAGEVPENLTVLFSVWHEYGLTEYARVAHLSNVKAFAYDDGAFDYDAAGFPLQTYCKAYDDSGKLDHAITCDKCKKCFNRSAGCKCIGCKAH